MTSIVIASSHSRNRFMTAAVETAFPDYRVNFVSNREELLNSVVSDSSPDWIFFPHWQWKVPDIIYSRHRCVIFHMTELPFGRGGSPLQNLIVRHYKDTLISAVKCVEELDAGPLYLQAALDLSGNAEEILVRAGKIILSMILRIIETNPTPIEQEGIPTYFKRRRPEDGNLSQLRSLREVYNYIRMLDADGYPNAFLSHKYLTFEFSGASLHDTYVDAAVRIKLNCDPTTDLDLEGVRD